MSTANAKAASMISPASALTVGEVLRAQVFNGTSIPSEPRDSNVCTSDVHGGVDVQNTPSGIEEPTKQAADMSTPTRSQDMSATCEYQSTPDRDADASQSEHFAVKKAEDAGMTVIGSSVEADNNATQSLKPSALVVDGNASEIGVADVPPTLAQHRSSIAYAQGVVSSLPNVMLSVEPTIAFQDGAIVAGTWEFKISPPLPAGLHFDSGSGRLYGVRECVGEPSVHEVLAKGSCTSGVQHTLRTTLRLLVLMPPSTTPPPKHARRPQQHRASNASPKQSSAIPAPLQQACFKAICAGDAKALQSLHLQTGILHSHYLEASSVVDDEGRTFLGAAREKGNLAVLKLMYKQLMGSIGKPAPVFKQEPLEIKPPEVNPIFSYPTLPAILAVGRTCLFEPQLQVQTSEESRFAYTVTPSLPEGLVIDWRSGVLRGTPVKEALEETYVVHVNTLAIKPETKNEPPISASTSICFRIMEPVRAVSYPNVEKVLNVVRGSGPEPQAFKDLLEHEEVARAPESGSCRDASKPALSKLSVLPIVEGGHADRFEIEPPLPLGMDFDYKTGAIRGSPIVTSRHRLSHHNILVENPLGLASCSVRIEAHSARWGGALMIVETIDVARELASTVHPGLKKSAESEAIHSIDWMQFAEKSLPILKLSCEPLQIRSSNGQQPLAVKGCRLRALVAALGLSAAQDAPWLLLRAINKGVIPSLMVGRELRGESIVYIQDDGDASAASAPSALAPFCAPPSVERHIAFPRIESKDACTVKNRFDTLVPLWRRTLDSCGPIR
eukprot:TRINITY_DN5975_c1_g1_i4.p1 TRINITY_DN5975_c1_g1~~TRINITY_DN5975_c1_g1_i4.p1  ORF type:complete len:916 (-),score=102.35 TRINITY_DN5975_c1_g1_i4:222-2573(-)